jgi:hypothetical protein
MYRLRGRGPSADQGTTGVYIAELIIDRHTVLLEFTYTSRRGQSAAALVSYWQFPERPFSLINSAFRFHSGRR